MLIDAARTVFARDGYHGARLGDIAREAGFSTGAVYSNFEGKTGLFLAVIDANMEDVDGPPWDVFADAQAEPDCGFDELIRGMALATLEFIAVAARDETLIAALAERIRVLIERHAEIAALSRRDDDPLDDAELGAMLAAFDQGVALLSLSGIMDADQGLLRSGQRRLVNPKRAAEEAASTSGGPAAVHDEIIHRRIAAARLRD